MIAVYSKGAHKPDRYIEPKSATAPQAENRTSVPEAPAPRPQERQEPHRDIDVSGLRFRKVNRKGKNRHK